MERFEDLDLSQQYTNTDYLSWKFSERVELLCGWVAKMGPSPNRNHQDVSAELMTLLRAFFRGSDCKAFAAPFDVRLLGARGEESVVQPDLCVICDPKKLTEQGCTGAPDWVIEILSPGNAKRELADNFELYQEAGVREYWLIHPEERSVMRYVVQENGRFVGLAPRTEESPAVEVSLFPSLTFRGADLFP